jgi:hypothetical protein
VGLIYGHVNEGIFAFLNWGISAGIPAFFEIPGIPRETCSTLMRSYKAVYIYTHMHAAQHRRHSLSDRYMHGENPKGQMSSEQIHGSFTYTTYIPRYVVRRSTTSR